MSDSSPVQRLLFFNEASQIVQNEDDLVVKQLLMALMTELATHGTVGVSPKSDIDLHYVIESGQFLFRKRYLLTQILSGMDLREEWPS